MFYVLISTVKSAKKFLDDELQKYESWEALNRSIKCLFKDDIEKCLNKSIKALFERKNMIVGNDLIFLLSRYLKEKI